jgi:hypothetical protein
MIKIIVVSSRLRPKGYAVIVSPSGGTWWRRGESNPRPETFSEEHLRAYPSI